MSIPEQMIDQMKLLSKAYPYNGNLSALCEDLFTRHIDGHVNEAAVHGLQHQFSKTAALIGQDIHALAGVVQTLITQVDTLATQLAGLVHLVTSVKTAQSHLEGLMETQRRDILDAIRRRTTGTPDPAPSSHSNGQAPPEKESFWRTHTGRRS